MTAFLPPNLLALFAPRDPIPYLAPVDKLCHEKKKVDVTGVSQFLKEFEDPKDTPPPTRVETKDERKERKKKERNEQIAYKLEQDLALWDPHNDPEGTSDPFKTLFVARVNFDTSESKIRREFEVYGPIRKIRQVHDQRNTKVRGFAFIEYEHERDMHSAYKHADGKKIDGRRVLVDVERGRTVKGWRPRRLGGGLGGTRKGGPEENTRFSGRDEFGGGVGGFGGRDDRGGGGGAGAGRSRSREREREPRRRRSRSRERKPRGRSRSRSREPIRRRSRERRPRSRERERSREQGPEEVEMDENGRARKRRDEGEPEEDGRPRKRRDEGEPDEDGRPRKRRDEAEPGEDGRERNRRNEVEASEDGRERNRRNEVEASEDGRERNRRNEEPDDENRSRKRSRRSRSRERTKRSRSRERKTRRRSRSRERRERRPEEGGDAPPGGDNGEEFPAVRIKVEKEVEGYGIYPGPEAVAQALNGAEMKEEPGVENEFEEQYGDY